MRISFALKQTVTNPNTNHAGNMFIFVTTFGALSNIIENTNKLLVNTTYNFQVVLLIFVQFIK